MVYADLLCFASKQNEGASVGRLCHGGEKLHNYVVPSLTKLIMRFGMQRELRGPFRVMV